MEIHAGAGQGKSMAAAALCISKYAVNWKVLVIDDEGSFDQTFVNFFGKLPEETKTELLDSARKGERRLNSKSVSGAMLIMAEDPASFEQFDLVIADGAEACRLVLAKGLAHQKLILIRQTPRGYFRDKYGPGGTGIGEEGSESCDEGEPPAEVAPV